MTKTRWAALLLCLLLAACQGSAGPAGDFEEGEVLASYDFSEPNTFEGGAYQNATLWVNEGVYKIRLTDGDNEIWWGQWGDTLTDTVIDVEVKQLSDRQENAFGIMCRVQGNVGQTGDADEDMAAVMNDEASAAALLELAAQLTPEANDEASATEEAVATEDAAEEDEAEPTESSAASEEESGTDEAQDDEQGEATEESATEEAEATAEATEEGTPEATEEPVVERGDGYLFLIQGNGSYGIFRTLDRELTPLVDWTNSEAINTGAAVNDLRAVCQGAYLAFYANEQFLASVSDNFYSEGQVGLAASASSRTGVQVEFDNLIVMDANPG